MKKFFKIFTFCLLLCGFLALAICYCVIPERTKEAIDIVVEYMNRPLGIGLGISITLSGCLFFIVKNVGIYLKNTNKINLDTHKEEMNNLVKKSKDYENKASSYYENTKAILKDFSNEIDNLTEKVIKVCETSPNAKIKALANEFKGLETEYKENITNSITKIDSGLQEVLEHKPSVEELQTKINELYEKIERLVDSNGKEE